MITGRRVAINTVIQILGRILGLAITLVTINYIANHLVVSGSVLKGFGQYSIVFAYVSIIGAAADLGLFTFLVRELTGKSSSEAGKLLSGALWFRFLLMLASLAIMAVIIQFLPYDETVKQAILLGVFVSFSMLFSQVIASLFQANILSYKIVISETVGKVVIAVLTLWALKAGYGLKEVVLANLAGNLLTFLISLLLAWPSVRLPRRPDLSTWKVNLPEFLPIAAVNLLGLAHFKIDTLLLSFLKNESDVGLYGLAYKIIEVVLVIPSIVATNLLPIMSARAGEGDSFSRLVSRSAQTMLAIAVPVVIFTGVFAPWLIVFVGQEEFLLATTPLRILSVAVLVIFISTLVAQAVIAARQQQRLVMAYLLALLLNLILNLLLIPKLSYNGAAITTLVTESILLVGFLQVLRRTMSGQSLQFGKTLTQVLVAGIGTCLISLVVLRLLPVVQVFAESGKMVQSGYLLLAFIISLGGFVAILELVRPGGIRSIVSIVRNDA